MMVNDNPLATVKPGYARADADNGARHFMTENAGGGVGAGVDLLQVRSADAAGGDLDQQFAGSDRGHGNRLDAHVVDAAIDYGAHGRGNPVGHVAFSVRGLGSHSELL
jgi:hypothetical protein